MPMIEGLFLPYIRSLLALVHTSDSSKMQRRKMGGLMPALHFVLYAEIPCPPARRLQMGARPKKGRLQMKFVDVVQ